MKIILVRHGRDPQDRRGGWSDANLTKQGIFEVEEAVNQFGKYSFDYIVSSDLNRARQTADIINKRFNKLIIYDPAFREINNGDLAGMRNDLAEKKFFRIYYNSLALNEKYPNGESPYEFFERIKKAFNSLIENGKDVLVVTHSGVINTIYCIVNNLELTNKKQEISVKHAGHIVIDI